MIQPRLLCCTFGSRGDLHPYIAVGLALRERGVATRIATGEEHRATVLNAGLEFAAVPPARTVFEQQPGMMQRIMDQKTGGEVIFREIVLPYVDSTYEATLDAARDCGAVLGHPLALTAPSVAEILHIPYIYAALQPLCFFSATDPPVLAPAPALHALRHLGPWAIRALYALMRLHMRGWGDPVHALRARLGLPRLPHNPVLRGLHSPLLNLGLFSPIIAPPQQDWPANTVAVGPCLYDDPHAAAEPARVDAFLSQPDPPLVVTLGSAAVEIGEAIFSAAAQAARSLNRRALLLTGPLEPPRECDGERIIAVPYAPFSRVFPRAAAVLHQCGAGTTAEAMRAGVPQVCVPFAHDQPDNAMRLARLHVGVTLDRARISGASIARAFERILDPREPFIAGAKQVGERSRAENGPARAADELCRVMGLPAR